MSEVPASVRHYLDQFARVAHSLPGRDLPWLKARRESAIKRFSELGFPGPRNEAWKYTRVAPIEKRAFVPPSEQSEAPAGEVERFYLSETDCHHLVFVDGRYSSALSSPGELPEGVLIEDLSGAIERAPGLLEEMLADGDPENSHAFSILNSAFMHDGAVIKLPRDGVVTYPIHLIFVATGRQGDFVTNPRVVIHAARGSRAAVVESYVSLDETVYFNNVRTDVIVGASACIEHYKLQRESRKAFHVSDLRVHQSAGSGFHSHSFSFGGALVRNDIRVGLDAEDADCSWPTAASTWITTPISTTASRAAPARSSTRGYWAGAPAGCSTARSTCIRARSRPTPTRPTTTCCFHETPKSTPSPSSKFTPTTSSALTERRWDSSTTTCFFICVPAESTSRRRAGCWFMGLPGTS